MKTQSIIPLLTSAVVFGGGYLLVTTLLKPDPRSTPATNSPSIPSTPSSSPPIPPIPTPTISNAPAKLVKDVPNVPAGIFSYGGSTTFAPLRRPEIEGIINQAYPNFQLRYYQPPPLTGNPGSGQGIQLLINGQLDFSQSSRPLKQEEYDQAKSRGFELEQIPVAYDGIAFYINPQLFNAGVREITLEEARDIFLGKTKNWKYLRGPDLPIIPFSRNLQAGGTVDYFNEQVLGKQPFGNNVQEVRNTTECIQKIGSNIGGIGYATTSEIMQQTIRPLRLAEYTGASPISPCSDPLGDACTKINYIDFKSGKYPLTRKLFIVIKKDGKAAQLAGEAYTNILLSDEGQKLIEDAGFVPLR